MKNILFYTIIIFSMFTLNSYAVIMCPVGQANETTHECLGDSCPSEPKHSFSCYERWDLLAPVLTSDTDQIPRPKTVGEHKPRLSVVEGKTLNARRFPQTYIPNLIVGGHVEGIGDRGSFRLLNIRDDRFSELIASVQVSSGRKEFFIDEVILHMGALGAMKKRGIKDYSAFKASVFQQLNLMSSMPPPISISDNNPKLSWPRWPITCKFYCSIHKSCEFYEWRGFFE